MLAIYDLLQPVDLFATSFFFLFISRMIRTFHLVSSLLAEGKTFWQQNTFSFEKFEISFVLFIFHEVAEGKKGERKFEITNKMKEGDKMFEVDEI